MSRKPLPLSNPFPIPQYLTNHLVNPNLPPAVLRSIHPSRIPVLLDCFPFRVQSITRFPGPFLLSAESPSETTISTIVSRLVQRFETQNPSSVPVPEFRSPSLITLPYLTFPLYFPVFFRFRLFLGLFKLKFVFTTPSSKNFLVVSSRLVSASRVFPAPPLTQSSITQLSS